VTSNRRLHRIAAFTAASVLFGVTSTVSALASQHPTTPVAAAAVVSNVDATQDAAPTSTSAASAAPLATPPAAAVPTRIVTAKKTVVTPAVVKKTTKPKATVTRPRVRTTTAAATHVSAPRERIISSYVDAPGSQKAIDSCKLVLWTHSPLWLAGHNWCGWQWMAYVPTGSIVKVTSGAAAGTFVVTGHLRLSRQSGALPAVNADLVLQTCIGSGTGLTLLRRV
jgi:hypothetical protein